MAAKVAKFRITGTYALLTHNPSKMTRGGDPDALQKKKIPSAEEEADAGLYKLPGGKFGIRCAAFRGAMLRAAMDKSKLGKEFASTVVKSVVFAMEEFAVLVDPKTRKPLTKYDIDVRRVVQQRQGILRARPRFEQWGCDVPLEYDDNDIAPKAMLQIMEKAGRRVGVGDYRPEKTGPFGRFTAEIID